MLNFKSLYKRADFINLNNFFAQIFRTIRRICLARKISGVSCTLNTRRIPVISPGLLRLGKCVLVGSEKFVIWLNWSRVKRSILIGSLSSQNFAIPTAMMDRS